MMQVMSLPYLLQSLVSANGATCVQPRPKGTVHHYPRHCMTNRPGSGTTMSTENGAGRLQRQCAVDGGSNAAMYGGAVVKKEIKTEEGSPAHYSSCPRDTYTQQIRYTLDYRVQRHSLKSHLRPTPSVSRIAMSLDTDSFFLQEASPLNPLDLTNDNASYYSATAGDLASFYEFPPQGSLDSGSLEMYGGSVECLTSPPYSSKMVDPNGSTCELLSLEELSNSSLGCDDYISSRIGNSLDQDWLIEPVSLPSPEEQDGDIKFSSLSPVPPQSLPFTTFQYPSIPVESSSPSLLTPDPSLPSTPLSIHSYSSEEEEIKDVLASFDDSGLDGTAAMTPFAVNVVLPPPQQQMVDISPSPTPSCSSPDIWTATSTPSSPHGSEGSTDCIRGMLSREELDVRRSSYASLPSLDPVESANGGIRNGNGNAADKSRKRKSLPITSSDKQSCAPTPATKRRLSKASKKERKREQNKTAALRYRQKKKDEKSDIDLRRAELEDTNSQLKAQVNSLSNEINYLKKLWSEVCEKRKQQCVSGSSSS